MEIKYEKIDTNNLRRWMKDEVLTNKQDLINMKSDYQFIINMADSIFEKLTIANTEDVKANAQNMVDQIDAILNLYNETPVVEEIDFVS